MKYLPNTKYGIPSYYVIASSEASANLARFDGIRYGYHSKEAQSLEELYKMSRSKDLVLKLSVVSS